jgi:molybdopterin converting factor small subunit
VSIKIKLTLPLIRLAGNQEKIEVTGATVQECLGDLVKKLPGARAELYDSDGAFALLVLLNNDPLPNQDLNYPVKDHDEIWLLSIVSGG